MAGALLWTTIAFLFAHELDAVRAREWRVLPLTAFLPDPTGRAVFIWAHVPLTLLMIWIAGQPAGGPAALALAGFAVVHLVLHLGYRHHPDHDFHGVGAWALIVIPALSGSAQIAIRLAG